VFSARVNYRQLDVQELGWPQRQWLDNAHIGVGASKFMGCEGFFPELPQICPKRCWATFAYKFSPTKIMKTFFWHDLHKRVFICFSANVGRHFLSQTTLGAIFAQIFRDFAWMFRDFAQICRDFANIFRDFAQIFDKSPAPPPLTPLNAHIFVSNYTRDEARCKRHICVRFN